MRINIQDLKYLMTLCKEHYKDEHLKKKMSNFFDKKKAELIVNGVVNYYWVIPVSKKKLTEIESWPIDFIKSISSDTELEKRINEIKPDLVIKKLGFVFLIKKM
jgi:hypothetical protein